MWIPSSLCQATQTTGADFVSARCPFSCHDRTGKLRARLENALSDAGIFYCYIDDFYSGNTEDIKQGALFKEMYRYIDNAVRLNIFEMFDEAIRTTRIEMSSAEKQQFISQYVKTMQMRITDSGDVVLEFKRK